MTTTGAKITITGRVQGVFFRKSTEAQALTLGVVGYVQNLPTGQVAVDVQGSQDAVEALIAFCQRGPELARVDDISVTRYAIASRQYDTFSIQRR